MVALASVLIIALLATPITRVATVALSLTGMSREAARFQARSALSGVGFTTSEAESVVDHPVRRRIILILMVLGSAGVVGAAASLILSFGGRADSSAKLERALILVFGLALLVMLSRSAWVDRRLAALIGIHRPDGEYVGVPRGDARIEPGDLLVLCATEARLEELDARRRGAQGDAAHERAALSAS